VVEQALNESVPVIARAPVLPKFLAPAQIEAMIGGCDPASVKGARDRAILLLLWRLGLRSGEVAGLRLGDIDWRAGTVSIISGKGGEALAAWLPERDHVRPEHPRIQQLRPTRPHRHSFTLLPRIPPSRATQNAVFRLRGMMIETRWEHILKTISSCCLRR
jgi:integrase